MVSLRYYPENLFHDCNRSSRNRQGIHADPETAAIERHCKNALFELIEATDEQRKTGAVPQEHLQPLETELNACEIELAKWPKRWRQVFYGKRSELEIRANAQWNLAGVRLSLPWDYNPPDWKKAATHDPKAGARRAMNISGEASTLAGAAALQMQTHAQPEESFAHHGTPQLAPAPLPTAGAKSLRADQTYRT